MVTSEIPIQIILSGLHSILVNLFWGLPNHVVALRTAEVIDVEEDLGVITAGMDLSDEDPVELRVGVASEGGAVVLKTKGNLFHIGCKWGLSIVMLYQTWRMWP